MQMIALCEQKAADFDIKAPLPSEANRWNVEFNKLHFENENEREAMHKKWNVWWQAHRGEYLPKKAAQSEAALKR
ncbi:MAG: hypothetical protein QM811_20000 [Pirellulales bacterium]